MILSDMHTHSSFSADACDCLADMVGQAKRLGLRYYGTAEHFDCDYIPLGLTYEGGAPVYTDASGYFASARALQREACDGAFTYLAGAEFGYSDDEGVIAAYRRMIAEYSPDFIINSVHTCDGADCWYESYFSGKDRRTAYSRYLMRVIRSLSAPYPYDIVAHVGYVSRNAPYADAKLNYCEFSELYDEILKGVIARGKILEVNASARGAGSAFLPDCDVLARYAELGGTKLSFASDAHELSAIARGGDGVAAALKKLGFTRLTVPCRGLELEVEL